MADRSSRSHTSPPAHPERRIIKVPVTRRWGPTRIAGLLRLNPATVHRALVRYRLNRLARTDRATSHLIRRHERADPGQLVYADIKKPDTIPDRDGHKTHGRHEKRKTRSGAGYSYLHAGL